MADELIEITWTSGSIDEARLVSRFLVQERLVASAQIIPWVESIAMLDNRLETVQESKVVYKTLLTRFDKVKEVILSNAKYDIPEVLYHIIDGGNEEYLRWLRESAPDLSTYDVR